MEPLTKYDEATALQLEGGLKSLAAAGRKEILTYIDDFGGSIPKVGKTDDLRAVVGAVFSEALKLGPREAWEFFRIQPLRRRPHIHGLALRYFREGIPDEYQTFSVFDGGLVIDRNWDDLEDRHQMELVNYYTKGGGRIPFKEWRINHAVDVIIRPFYNKGMSPTEIVAQAATSVQISQVA